MSPTPLRRNVTASFSPEPEDIDSEFSDVCLAHCITLSRRDSIFPTSLNLKPCFHSNTRSLSLSLHPRLSKHSLSWLTLAPLRSSSAEAEEEVDAWTRTMMLMTRGDETICSPACREQTRTSRCIYSPRSLWREHTETVRDEMKTGFFISLKKYKDLLVQGANEDAPPPSFSPPLVHPSPATFH